MEGKSKNGKQQERPRRGRPTGKNRVPLSLEERRARNAQYEKERRQETAQAMAALAQAAGCDPEMVQSDLLATVICFIKDRSSGESTEDVRALNERLMAQIADCERRLGVTEESLDLDDPVPRKTKRKREEEESSSGLSQKKYRKSARVVEEREGPAPLRDDAQEHRSAPARVTQPPAAEHAADDITIEAHNTFGLPFDDNLEYVFSTPSAAVDMNLLENWSIDEMISRYL